MLLQQRTETSDNCSTRFPHTKVQVQPA